MCVLTVSFCTVLHYIRIVPRRDHLFLACLVSGRSQGVLDLTLTSAHVLVRAPVDGQASQPIDTVDRTQRGPCSDAHFGRVPTACLSSPRDWSPLARTWSRTLIVLRRSTSKRTDRSRQQPRLNNWRSYLLRHECSRYVLQLVVDAPPGVWDNSTC